MIKIDVFYNTSCHICEQVKQEIINPLIRDGLITANFRNVDESANYLPLLDAMARFDKDFSSPTVVGDDFILSGKQEIEAKLANILQNKTDKKENISKKETVAITRQEIPFQFNFATVTSAGLIDSINPCAIATIIFFIAYLRVKKATLLKVLLLGSAFCLGVFLTYLLVGLGLLSFLYRFEMLFTIRYIINYFAAFICLIFGFLSFYDAILSKNNKSEKMILQLPDWAKNLIHGKIRSSNNEKDSKTKKSFLGKFFKNKEKKETKSFFKTFFSYISLFISSFILGSIIAVVEGICTGQVYLPTIIYLTKIERGLSSFLWLLWYNLLFILPLIILMILAMIGISQKKIEQFFNKNIFISKILLALLFFALAILLFIYN